MKKSLLYLLLFAYTIIVCKPVLPTLADGMAHIFWYNQHMATIHYEHGKYHVHYEYQAAAKNNYPQKDSTLPKSENIVSDHLVTATEFHFSLHPLPINYQLANTPHLPKSNPLQDFLPPKA